MYIWFGLAVCSLRFLGSKGLDDLVLMNLVSLLFDLTPQECSPGSTELHTDSSSIKSQTLLSQFLIMGLTTQFFEEKMWTILHSLGMEYITLWFPLVQSWHLGPTEIWGKQS